MNSCMQTSSGVWGKNVWAMAYGYPLRPRDANDPDFGAILGRSASIFRAIIAIGLLSTMEEKWAVHQNLRTH